MAVAHVDPGPPDVPLERVRGRGSRTFAADAKGPGSFLPRRKWREWFGDQVFEYPAEVERPISRADCLAMPRPCPFVSCSHHLALDVNPMSGALTVNFPELEIEEIPETCSLDVADRGGATLDEVGRLTNRTRERVRQIQEAVLRRLAQATNKEEACV